MPHTLFENSRIARMGALGSTINTFAGGTGAPVYAGDHEYHAIIFAGTIGNVGTLWAYGHTGAAGEGTTVLGSIAFGSTNSAAVVYEVKSDTLTGLGTNYTYLSGGVTVQSGGTLTGALFILSTWPRSAGTTPAANGYSAVGTSLY
jgi:hypothetical protein